MPERPLYVRLPREEADRLDRAAEELRTSKRELVTRLVAQKLDTLTVGHHEFRPAAADDVLTPAQAAELLQVEEAEVLALAEAGELPGRRIGGEWRFARAALLSWLGGPVS
jgi:excisionase family DNA binding protein